MLGLEGRLPIVGRFLDLTLPLFMPQAGLPPEPAAPALLEMQTVVAEMVGQHFGPIQEAAAALLAIAATVEMEAREVPVV